MTASERRRRRRGRPIGRYRHLLSRCWSASTRPIVDTSIPSSNRTARPPDEAVAERLRVRRWPRRWG